ncbi:GDSL-type esterase/lipase family protein [Lentisphaerota bacterium WC36G]|nr:GDSL-type esterase/lipase family protein [Lentisphaerae bacterium WC36]
MKSVFKTVLKFSFLIIISFNNSCNQDNSNNSKAVRVACVGDSITYGYGIQNRKNNSYPAQLGRISGNKYDVRNFGVSGSTMLRKGNKPYWNEKKFFQALKFNPNIVIIKLGTNDSKTVNWQYKRDYMTNYVEMVQKFQNLPAKPKIYICYPVPAYDNAWTISDKIIREEITPAIDLVAEKTSAQVIDLYQALSYKENMFPDKIHPNKKGASIIAQQISQAIH